MVTTNATKWTAITALLAEASSSTTPTLFLNYTSGYQTKSGLPNNPSVAVEINEISTRTWPIPQTPTRISAYSPWTS